MRLSPPLSRAARPRRGFSLTELAIVFAIASVIIAGIWTYAGQAWKTTSRQKAMEEVTAVVTGVRSAYLNTVSIGGGYNGLTQQAVTYNAIPSQYVRTTGCTATGGVCADSPWGPTTNATVSAHGSLGICDWTAAKIASGSAVSCTPTAPPFSPGNQYFAVELQGLASDDCIALATQLSAPQGPPGLMDVAINTSSILGVGASKSLPVSVPDAEKYCAAVPAPPAYATLDFIYRLRAPMF